ncbi:MAG: SDR family oxidoreductase [Chloroflexi bacterium]|nr:SDR family oxidoreductase [Chloroflexota bacterium]MBV9544156.1 SDR family oxidoreductase [Chloroflexota bacterium]
MPRLSEKVAAVTGAGSGNGLAIAQAYAREGCAVAIGEFSQERGEAAADAIERDGGRAIFVRTDVRNWEDIDGMIAQTLRELGRLDVVVNNAGVLDGYATCLETSTELFETIMAINVRGVFFGCKRALEEMVPRGYGKIINIASVAGLQAMGGGLAYTTSKHAVVGMTRQLAAEYGPGGIRVNAICPGSIATNLRQNTAEIIGVQDRGRGMGTMAPEAFAQWVPLGVRGAPSDVANAAVFLASADSDYMNGHTLVVDGGWSIR